MMSLLHADRLAGSRRVLEPEERIAEVIFGLIMVITFTGSLSVAEAGRDDVRTMIIGAFGCNLAWGIIDGVLYVLGCLADRGRRVQLLRALKRAGEGAVAEKIVLDALPPLVASVLERGEVAELCRRLAALPEPVQVARLNGADALGALGVFILVFSSTFPVALPFVLVHDVPLAMRLSNAVALVMLLVAGAAYGRIVGRSRVGFGLAMVALGLALVALTLALGG